MVEELKRSVLIVSIFSISLWFRMLLLSLSLELLLCNFEFRLVLCLLIGMAFFVNIYFFLGKYQPEAYLEPS